MALVAVQVALSVAVWTALSVQKGLSVQKVLPVEMCLAGGGGVIGVTVGGGGVIGVVGGEEAKPPTHLRKPGHNGPTRLGRCEQRRRMICSVPASLAKTRARGVCCSVSPCQRAAQ